MLTQRDLFWLGGGIVAGVALAAGFPKIRQKLGPAFAEASERAGDVFSTLVETISAQAERAQDNAAERRAAG